MILLVKKILDITDIDIHLIIIIMYTFKLSYILTRGNSAKLRFIHKIYKTSLNFNILKTSRL